MFKVNVKVNVKVNDTLFVSPQEIVSLGEGKVRFQSHSFGYHIVLGVGLGSYANQHLNSHTISPSDQGIKS